MQSAGDLLLSMRPDALMSPTKLNFVSFGPGCGAAGQLGHGCQDGASRR
jgi:hypothetical protein